MVTSDPRPRASRRRLTLPAATDEFELGSKADTSNSNEFELGPKADTVLSEIESEAAIKSSVKSSVGMDKRKFAAKPYTTGVVVELTDKEKRATH
jgi:hypothetical protein